MSFFDSPTFTMPKWIEIKRNSLFLPAKKYGNHFSIILQINSNLDEICNLLKSKTYTRSSAFLEKSICGEKNFCIELSVHHSENCHNMTRTQESLNPSLLPWLLYAFCSLTYI